MKRVLAWIDALDQRIFADQAARHSPAGDAVLPRLTRAADYSRLWIGVAAVLSATGGRRSRRAAARGLGSIALASLLANQVGKSLWPRARPQHETVPLVRRARRIPISPSFPSGHTASAAAFAVGASLERPELAVPLGLAAAGVGWSRVYTGVHYPTDVLAGAALGAACAALLARVVPLSGVRRDEPDRLTRVQLAPRPTGAGVVVVINHLAGPAGRQKHVAAIRKALPDAEIVDVAPAAGDASVDLGEQLDEACRRGAEVLAVSGGDGSVSTAAAIAQRHGVPLAVFPGGTLNHFARDLGVLTVADTLAAIRAGSAAEVSVGTVTARDTPEPPHGSGEDDGGSIFVNTASLGSYPAFVQTRQRWQKRLGKPVASAVAARSVLRNYRPSEVTVNGVPRRIGLFFIGNGRYAPPGFVPEWRPSPGDGVLDLRLWDARGALPRTRLVIDLLFGRVSRSADYLEHAVRSVEITRPGPGLVALDGEIAPAPAALRFAVHPRPITVYRPVKIKD